MLTLSRRRLLAASLALPACGSEEDEMSSVMRPTHLWGQQRQMDFTDSSQSIGAQQVVNVEYHRPESWNFLFFARIDNATGTPLTTMRAIFDLNVGVGLATFTFYDFAQINWTPAQIPNQIGVSKIMREVELLLPNNTATRNLCNDFPAQNIQISVRGVGGGLGSRQQVTVGAMVAPIMHFRPDWLRGAFSGELGGR